jgi:hypothetical protein
MNIGAFPVDLTGAAFTAGIEFVLPSRTLVPGERVVIARSRAAFQSRHPAAASSLLDGEYYAAGDTNKLSNSGEQIVLADVLGADIRRFAYGDAPPWPSSSDGDGYSLVLIAPQGNPAHGDPFNWRSSTAAGGNPGSSDAAAPFSGDPDLDGDADRLTALMEHALGTSDAIPDPGAGPAIGSGRFVDGGGVARQYLTITYRRNLAADDVVFEVQVGADLEAWSALGTVLVSAVNHGDGFETVTYRSLTPLASVDIGFIRLLVRQR